MEQKKCKKCQRTLPESYKHKYCQNCLNEKAKHFKDASKGILGALVMVGGTVVAIATKGKINLTKK